MNMIDKVLLGFCNLLDSLSNKINSILFPTFKTKKKNKKKCKSCKCDCHCEDDLHIHFDDQDLCTCEGCLCMKN